MIRKSVVALKQPAEFGWRVLVPYKGREFLDKSKEVSGIEVPSLDIDERIKRMRERLSMGNSSSSSSLSDNGRLNEIENKIAALTARLEVLEVQKQEPNKRKKKTAKTVTQRTQKLAK